MCGDQGMRILYLDIAKWYLDAACTTYIVRRTTLYVRHCTTYIVRRTMYDVHAASRYHLAISRYNICMYDVHAADDTYI